jgi:hypothetical protein
LKNTIRGTLALALLLAACGDDGGDGAGDDDGNEDAGSLTLEEALETAGTDTSKARAELVFPAACEEQEKCETIANCASSGLSTFESMRSGRSTACLDATLDLYACFASNPCANGNYDTVCNDAGQAQKDACD